MLKLVDKKEGHWRIRQTVNSPFIYLDLNALILLSRETALSGRFSAVLQKHQGTIGFSWMHFVELSGAGQRETVLGFARYLQSLNAHLVFMDSDALRCQKREDNGANMPFIDEGFTKRVLIHARKGEIGEFDVELLFANAENMKDRLTHIRDRLLPLVRRLRRHPQPLKPELRKYKSRFCPSLIQDLGFRAFVKQKSWNLDKLNHWADWMHITVPLTYCDAVVMDGNWLEQCNQWRKYLNERAPGRFHLAYACRGTRDGLEGLIEELERRPTRTSEPIG